MWYLTVYNYVNDNQTLDFIKLKIIFVTDYTHEMQLDIKKKPNNIIRTIIANVILLTKYL